MGAHRNAALDSLRGLAIVLVLVCHIDDVATIIGGRSLGSAGVTAFFTLVGFLISVARAGGLDRIRSGSARDTSTLAVPAACFPL